jgi:hypothetical protein
VTVAGTRKLVIEILGNAKDAAAAFGDVRKHSDITKERLDKFGTAALGAGVAIAGGLAFAVKEFVEADTQSRKLDNSIKNSTQSFSRSGDAIRELTTSIQNMTGADGDALVGASALAVQWGLSESQINQLLPLVNDLSMKMGVDVDSAMKAVLKSSDGSTTALRKMGIQVDATKSATDPFAATMDALKGSVQGFGEEVGNTSAGKLNILKQQLGDLVEAVGGGALDVFGPVVSGLTNFINGAGPAGQAAGDMAGKVLAISSAGLIAVGGIAKMASAFDNVKGALTNAEGGLNNFGRAAGVIGAAGAAIAILQIANAANEATRNLDGAAASLTDFKNAGSQADALGALVNQAMNLESVGDRLWDSWNQKIYLTDDNVNNLKVTLGNTTIPIDSLNRALDNTKKSGDMGALAQQIELVRNHAQGGKQEWSALNEVLGQYDDAIKGATGSTKGSTDAQGKNATAVAATTEAIDEQNAALKALTDPVFGAMRAQQQNTAAQEKYAEAQNKVTFLMAAGKAGSGQLAAAQRELQTASIDAGSSAVNQQSALASLGGAMANGSVSASGLNATLSGLVASGQLSAGAALTLAATFNNGTAPAASNAAGKTLGLTAAVKSVPGSANTTFTANTDQAMAKINELTPKIGLLRAIFTATTPGYGGRDGNPATPQATGGTVRGDRPYLVGERGPEVIVPGSGYVIPTRRLVDQQPAMAGGGGITVNVTAGVGDPVAIGRTVVESLKAYERTSGTSWRN